MATQGHQVIGVARSLPKEPFSGKFVTRDRNLTLKLGDILFTGLPSGSAGVHGGRFLKLSDRIHAEIEHIGSLDVIRRQD